MVAEEGPVDTWPGMDADYLYRESAILGTEYVVVGTADIAGRSGFRRLALEDLPAPQTKWNLDNQIAQESMRVAEVAAALGETAAVMRVLAAEARGLD